MILDASNFSIFLIIYLLRAAAWVSLKSISQR